MEGRGENGSFGYLWEVLPGYIMINNHLRRKKDKYIELTRNITTTTDENTFLNTCIMNAWFEFDKYFKRLNKSPAYYASTALHPALK